MKRLRLLMLPVATGGNVCYVLKCSNDGRRRPPIRCPDNRAVVNTLLPQFSDFIPVMRKFTIDCRLCSISASCRCNGGGYAHVQDRTASWDSSGGQKISAGLDCEAPSPLGSAVMPAYASFTPQNHGLNTRVVPRVASAVLQVSACSS